MRRLTRVLLIALLAALLLALAGGCAANRQAVRPGAPTVTLRLPPAETMDLRLRQEPAPAPTLSVPLSVSDESRGRWLTLFEMDVTPSEAAGIPAAPPGAP